MRHSTQPRGTIMIVTVIAVFILASISAALLYVATTESKAVEQSLMSEQALQCAESAVDRALVDLMGGGAGNVGTASWSAATDDLGADGTGATTDAGEGDGLPTMGEPNVTPMAVTGGLAIAWTVALPTGELSIRSTGSYGGAWRSLAATALARPSLPFPGANGSGDLSAFAILGALDKAKVKLHDSLAKSKDDAAGAGLVFNGNDKAGKKSAVTGMGIEDNETYNEFAERYDKDVIKGKLSELTLQGLDKTVAYSTKKGSGTFDASLQNVGDNSAYTAFLATLGDKIEAAVQKNIIPNANTTITGKDATLKGGTITWGTPASPEITVIDAAKLHMHKGTTVTGAGVLVINGRFDLHDGDFSFDGPVIVLGSDNKDSRMHVHHANMTVNGPLVVIGNDKGKAAVHIHNEDGTKGNNSGTTINGAFLALAAGSSAKKEEARLHYHHGNFTLNGFLGMFGDDRARMHVHGLKDTKNDNKQGSFNVNGATMIGSTTDADDPKGGRVDVHLHGANLGFNYDSIELARGMKSITDLLGTISPDEEILPPARFGIVAWQDLGWRQ